MDSKKKKIVFVNTTNKNFINNLLFNVLAQFDSTKFKFYKIVKIQFISYIYKYNLI